MRNRIKRFNRENADTEKLLKEAETSINKVFADFDLSDMTGKVLEGWKVDLQMIMISEQKGRDELITDEDTSELINILNRVKKITKDPEAPEDTKALAVEMYFRRLLKYTLLPEKYHGEKLFERRAEIEKDNPLRDFFIVRYIESQVYPRFYEAETEARDAELKAKGIDLDKYYEELDENMTQEELDRDNKEWREHTEELFREYGEDALIGYEPLNAIKEWQKKLPEEIKKEMAEREAQSNRELDIMEKVIELTETKGITDEEAVKLLTDEEREILRKADLKADNGETTP